MHPMALRRFSAEDEPRRRALKQLACASDGVEVLFCRGWAPRRRALKQLACASDGVEVLFCRGWAPRRRALKQLACAAKRWL